VALHNVEAVDTEAREQLVDRGGYVGGGKVKPGLAVAADFGADDDLVAELLERLAEVRFGLGRHIIGADVERLTPSLTAS